MRPFLCVVAFAAACALMWPFVGWIGLLCGALAAGVAYLVALFATIHYHSGPTIF